MVNVTKSNFIEQSNDLLKHLPTAAFVAIDEEMTGINVPTKTSRRPPKDESPGQRYAHQKQAPETYSIIQLGITLFHVSPDSASGKDWKARRYNFFVFPGKDSERSVVLNPAAVAFLHEHNISFDQWTKEGVTFQCVDQAEEIVKNYVRKEQQRQADERRSAPQKQPTTQEVSRRRVQLRRAEDIDFFSRAMARLRAWLDDPIPEPDDPDEAAETPEGATFLLPECNSFLRRALYEAIGQEYPSLILEKAGPEYPNRIRVWRLTDEERERRQERLRVQAWRDMIVDQVGLYRVFHGLSQACRGFDVEYDNPLLAPSLDEVDWNREESLYRGAKNRKIPVVVHNGFMDLCFLLTHFVRGKLPDKLSDCKALIRRYFPVVYDTKILATECSRIHQNENTRLAVLYDRVRSQMMDTVVDVVDTSSMSGEPAAPLIDQEHEAAFDAYMTGICYIGLCHSIQQSLIYDLMNSTDPEAKVVGSLVHLLEPEDDVSVRQLFGRNLLYHMSIYTMDLESLHADCLSKGLDAKSAYRVSNASPSVNTRDVVNTVSHLIDRRGQVINFEILWVDDTTFIVAASHPRHGGGGWGSSRFDIGDTTSMLMEHGELIGKALERRFDDATVVSLQEHLDRVEQEQPSGDDHDPSLLTRLWSWVGASSRSSKRVIIDWMDERQAKRARHS